MATNSPMAMPGDEADLKGDFPGSAAIGSGGDIIFTSGRLVRAVHVASSYTAGYTYLFLRNMLIMIMAGFHFKIEPHTDATLKWAVRAFYAKKKDRCNTITVYRWNKVEPNLTEFDKNTIAGMEVNMSGFEKVGDKVPLSRLNVKKVKKWFFALGDDQVKSGAKVTDGMDDKNQYKIFAPMNSTVCMALSAQEDTGDDDVPDKVDGVEPDIPHLEPNPDEDDTPTLDSRRLATLPLENWPKPLRDQYKLMTAAGNKKYVPNTRGPKQHGPKEAAFTINREIQQACQAVGKHQLYIDDATLLLGYRSHILPAADATKEAWMKANNKYALSMGLRQGRAVITAGMKAAIRNHADALVEILVSSRQQMSSAFSEEEVKQRSTVYKAMQLKKLNELTHMLDLAHTQHAMTSGAGTPNAHDIQHSAKQVQHFTRLVRETEMKVRAADTNTGPSGANENCVPYLVMFFQVAYTVQQIDETPAEDALTIAGKFCHIVSCTELTSGQTKAWTMVKALTTDLVANGHSVSIRKIAMLLEETFMFTTDAKINTPPTTFTPGRLARCSAFIYNQNACNPFCISGMEPGAQMSFVVRLFQMERRVSRLLKSEMGPTLAPLILHHILKDRITPAILPINKMTLDEIIKAIEDDTFAEQPRDITGLKQRTGSAATRGTNVWDRMTY
jgi:hypothetical protein